MGKVVFHVTKCSPNNFCASNPGQFIPYSSIEFRLRGLGLEMALKCITFSQIEYSKCTHLCICMQRKDQLSYIKKPHYTLCNAYNIREQKYIIMLMYMNFLTASLCSVLKL